MLLSLVAEGIGKEKVQMIGEELRCKIKREDEKEFMEMLAKNVLDKQKLKEIKVYRNII